MTKLRIISLTSKLCPIDFAFFLKNMVFRTWRIILVLTSFSHIPLTPVFQYLLHIVRFSCAFRTPRFSVLCGIGAKKMHVSVKKVGKKFCQFAELSYLCTRFRKKIGGRAGKSVFRCPLEEAIFDILQTATRQQLACSPDGVSGHTDQAKKQDTSIHLNRIQWIPIERKCLGQ